MRDFFGSTALFVFAWIWIGSAPAGVVYWAWHHSLLNAGLSIIPLYGAASIIADLFFG